jgi:hypothetical protein
MISSRQHFERHLPFYDGATGLPVIQDRPGADFGPDTTPCGEQAPAPDPSIINFDLLCTPSSTAFINGTRGCHVGGH